MKEFTFARQPIFDSSLKLYAYEFLYRPTVDKDNSAHSITSEVLSSSILDLGLDKASKNKLAFINMSYNDIMSAHIEALPADKLILELLEDIRPDKKIISNQRLVRKRLSFCFR